MKMGTPNALVTNEQNHGNKKINSGSNSIEAFFAASVIFVTGATGFIGKTLVEKLLRSCPRISTIYILIRLKKNLSLEDRLKSLLKNSVFDRIKLENPDLLNKIVPIMGDMSLPNLGLSDHDRLLLTQNVNIVFHSAATVRFDEPLAVAIVLNTRGTQKILELASEMINLISFIHVSTAYSNADRKEIDEMIYNSKITPEVAISMADHLDDELLNSLEKKLKGDHPNTYTFTKSLAEILVSNKNHNLPIAIVRPSIVGAAYHEPLPGWIDNAIGINAMVLKTSLGAVRVAYVNGKATMDLIPVDYVINTIIAAAWCNKNRNSSVQIYNCVSGPLNPITWEQFKLLTIKNSIEFPTKHAFWYPGVFYITNVWLHKVMCLFLHSIPAYIVDISVKLIGGKAIMVKLMNKFSILENSAKFFTIREWKFSNDNVQQLSKSLKTASDGNNFTIDVREIDWDVFFTRYVLGIRQFVVKDNLETIPLAKNRIMRFYWIQKLVQVLMIFILYNLIFNKL